MDSINSSEILAKNILIKAGIFEEKEFDESKCESPDFIIKNGKIGIEVTIVNNSMAYGNSIIKGMSIDRARNKEAYIKYIGGKVMSEGEAKAQNKFILYKENGKAFVSFDLDMRFGLINERVKLKLDKLQKYNKCEEYQLFIWTPCLFIEKSAEIHKEEVQREIVDLDKLYSNYNLKYDIIYLYTGNILYTINMNGKYFEYKYLKLDVEILKQSNII